MVCQSSQTWHAVPFMTVSNYRVDASMHVSPGTQSECIIIICKLQTGVSCLIHFIPYRLGCGASCDSSDILA